jgi:hypothetical protein
MRHLHKSVLNLIHETAIAYAIADVDSYIHIDNFMAINKSKFKNNARVLFAERTLLREAAAASAPPATSRQGVQRTWGQAFSDFASGGFSGLAKGKADLERNYTLAIQNLEQMLNLLDEHPESTTPEVIQTLNKSVNAIIKELQEKQPLIKKTSDQMKGVAMDKHRGEAPRGYYMITLNDMEHLPLDKNSHQIYNAVMESPELMYTVSQAKFDIKKDEKKLQRLGFDALDIQAIKAFANDYANKKYKPSGTQYTAANINPQLIYNYLAASKRWEEAKNIGKTILTPTPTPTP